MFCWKPKPDNLLPIKFMKLAFKGKLWSQGLVYNLQGIDTFVWLYDIAAEVFYHGKLWMVRWDLQKKIGNWDVVTGHWDYLLHGWHSHNTTWLWERGNDGRRLTFRNTEIDCSICWVQFYFTVLLLLL